ncbi:unnamed protein product [Discosporangium mesarthrocarpum]
MSGKSALFVPSYGGAKKSSVGNENGKRGSGRVLPLSSKTTPGLERGLQHQSDLVFNGNIHYIQTQHEADKAGKALLAARPHALGFDLEWAVSFVAGEASLPTATLQLCAPQRPADKDDSYVWETAFIFHLSQMATNPRTDSVSPVNNEEDSSTSNGAFPVPRMLRTAENRMTTGRVLPESLVQVLTDSQILLPGVGVWGDVARLESEYVQLRENRVRGVIDLSEMARQRGQQRRANMRSLAGLSSSLLGRHLPKPAELRQSNWERSPLTAQQLCYAATDAYAGLRLLQVLDVIPTRVSSSVSPDRDSGKGGSGSAAHHRQLRLSPSKYETYRLWHEQGMSIHQTAVARCISENTVRDYLTDCIECGLPLEWHRMGIDPELEHLITRALDAVAAAASLRAAEGPASQTNTGAGAGAGAGGYKHGDEQRGKGTTGGGSEVAEGQGWGEWGVKKREREETGRQGQGQGHSSLWRLVRVKEVKQQLPDEIEYWQIKLVLAWLKSPSGRSPLSMAQQGMMSGRKR